MTKQKIGSILRYVFLGVASLLSVFPIYYMLVSSTNDNQGVLSGILLPGAHFVDNLKALTELQPILRGLWNSFVIAAILTLVSLVACSIAGYAFQVFRSKGKNLLMNILLLAMMVPFAATLVPLFRMFTDLGFNGSFVAVILPSVSTPFLIMMFRQSAQAFPYELIEAARIEGLSELGIFARIFFPIMRSTYAAAMTITFMTAWNNYMWPRVVLTGSSDKLTMPMLVANLTAGYVTQYGVLMLAVLISTVPTLIIFLLLQKSFSNGIVGAVK
jgi:lactose/L-arabinose transport system permease protein